MKKKISILVTHSDKVFSIYIPPKTRFFILKITLIFFMMILIDYLYIHLSIYLLIYLFFLYLF